MEKHKVKREGVALTCADGHLCAASCCEVLEDDRQLTTTRELQKEAEDTFDEDFLISNSKHCTTRVLTKRHNLLNKPAQ